MPRFLGIFTRKSKHAPAPASGSDDHDSSVSVSPTMSSSQACDKSHPSRTALHAHPTPSVYSHHSSSHGDRYSAYPPPPSPSSIASTSKLRLPFTRKRQQSSSTAAMTSTTSVNTTETHSVTHREFHSAPRPSLPGLERTSFASDGELTELRRLRPPPSKSAIFAAYADPQSALSTRSLPNEASPQPFALSDSERPPHPSINTLLPPQAPMYTPDSATKKSFFSWTKSPAPIKLAKSRSKSSPPSQVVQDSKAGASLGDMADSSFNLKSFRHVGPSPVPDSPVTGTTLSVPNPSPIPRPRGPSVGESSQRISVAAFREAQSRRSMASSPVPSFRSSSPFSPPTGLQEAGGASGRASPRLHPARSSFIKDSPRGSQFLQNKGAFASDSDAETSSAIDESDDDSDRERTVTQRGVWNGKTKTRAKSELGHGSPRQESMETRSEVHHARPQSRRRASVSTSALAPSSAAKRASILINPDNSDPGAEHKPNSRHIREPNVFSNSATSMVPERSTSQQQRPPSSSSSSSSEDDAPLATLVPPRRPGSALSTASGSSLQNRNRSTTTLPPARGKPLIDINEIMGGKPTSLPIMQGRKEELREDKGFTPGNTLLSASTSINTISSSRAKVPPPISTSFITSGPHTLSPTESVNSSGFATAPSSLKAPLPGRSSPAPTITEQAAAKRDVLNDRLARVAKSASSVVNFPSPLSTPLSTPNPNDTSTVGATKPMAFPRASASPRPSFETPKHASPSNLALRRSTDLSIPLPPRIPAFKQLKPSPPDEELMQMLGASIKLISRTGESSPEAIYTHDSSESEDSDEESSDDDDEQQKINQQDDEKATDEWEKVDPGEVNGKEEYEGRGTIRRNKVLGRVKDKGKEKEATLDALAPKVTEPPIAPIPIKQRAPTPSFSVMSRPPLVRSGLASSTSGSGSGPLSVPGSTLTVPSSTSSRSTASSSSSGTKTRRRSSTLLNPSSSSLEFPSSKSPASSLSPAASSDSARARTLGPPALRTPAMSRGSGISGGSVQDSISHPEPKRSSMIDSPFNSGGRQRSSTMLPTINVPINVSSVPAMPVRPFARRESPASSGDSSSGRVPLTPRDGSDIGSTGRATLGIKHAKRRSVSFEDELRDDDAATPSAQGKGKIAHKESEEEKRRERRRGEAKAAIELGNVINGRGPIVDNDEEDMPINQTMQARMSTLNPMMAMGGGMHPVQMGSMPSWNGPWGNPVGQRPMMNGPQFMLPPTPADPSLIAAHHQAMMIAKQAYQMAVAQQAVVAAGDEWERGSVASGFAPFGGGISGPHMAPPYGVGMNMNMNVNMGMMGMGANWPSGGSTIYPQTTRSMYGGGISGARSDYGGGGGGGGGGGWNSSRSTYGETFGPPTGRVQKSGEPNWRDSTHHPPVPPIPPQAQGSPGGRTPAPRARTTSQPASARSGARRAPPPPSSWKGA